MISRSSAMQYANTGKSMREIGRELGVDYVLEGTVRWDRRGDSSRVRVTPQLIRVADDTNLWSDRYDREMEDIFDVQSEIATKVVEELGLAVMRPEERKAISARPTDNLEAYQAYLRGQEKNIFGSREETELAIRMYERAVNLDPGFALAWADLSKTHSAMYHWMIDPTEGRLAKARESADMALRLDPDLLESHLALAYYYYWGRKDYDQALEAISAAGESWKNDSEVLQAVGYIQRRQGKWDESIENLEMAFQLSPREAMLPNQIGQTYQSLRRYPEAIRYFDRAISIAPDKSEHYGAKALAYLGWTGDPEAARRIMAEAPGSDVPGMTLGLMWLDTMAGDYDRVLETLDDYPEEVFESQDTFVPKALFRGLIYLGKDDPDSARSACQEALARLREEIEKRPRDPRVRSALATALACAGFKDEAVREARLTVDIYSVSSDAMAGPAFLGRLAEVYALVGEDEAALDLLDRLLDMPAGAEATVVALHPVWSSFRDNPRFRQILAKPR